MSHRYTVKEVMDTPASIGLLQEYGPETTCYTDLKIALEFGEKTVKDTLKNLHAMFDMEIDENTTIIDKNDCYVPEVMNYLELYCAINWNIHNCYDGGLTLKEGYRLQATVLQSDFVKFEKKCLEQAELNKDFSRLFFRWTD